MTRSAWASQLNRTHGGTGTVEYRAWVSMRERCYRTNHKHYADYGGRGITVCERWRYDFRAFLSDMGHRPAGMTLERIDNDKGYGPDNCVWAGWRQQQNNRRSNVRIEFGGMCLTVAQWARRLGIRPDTLQLRIRSGIPTARALSSADLRRKEQA